jgi:regulator of protease activity HflC (stomatin/prohibitin superfamily)
MDSVSLAVLGVIAFAVFILTLKSFRVVGQASVMIVERLGRFHKIASSGLNIILPFLDRPRPVHWSGMRPGLSTLDLRETLLDFPPQPVITRDNVTVGVDSVLYYQITDPIKSVYEVADLTGSIMQLTITAMRSIIGDLDLDHTFTSRDVINQKLRVVLDEATDRWGVKVTRVEIRNIHPPEDVRVTMEKQMTAERNRRALILQADGEKQAAIARAEGEKQAAIARAAGEKEAAVLRAEGQAEARLRTAEAEAQAIRQIAESITAGQGNPAQYLLVQRYIESLTQMAAANNSKVVFMPVETSAVLSSIGAFKEIFGEAPSTSLTKRGGS